MSANPPFSAVRNVRLRALIVRLGATVAALCDAGGPQPVPEADALDGADGHNPIIAAVLGDTLNPLPYRDALKGHLGLASAGC